MSSSEEMKTTIVVDESENLKGSQEKLENTDGSNNLEDDSEPTFHKGEPVINTGLDVSRYVVDIRDDGETALTFRCMFIGTVFAVLAAAVSQVGIF